ASRGPGGAGDRPGRSAAGRDRTAAALARSVTAAQSPPRWPARTWLAFGISATVLALAVAGGVRSSPAGLGPLIFVESLSARISGIFLSLGAKAPRGSAVVAGMVASVTPCGFVLLPAYLGYYLGDDRAARSARGRIGRALAVSATVTASFALLFGLAGILAGLAASALSSSLPWIGTAVGVGLILLAGILASGPGADRVPGAAGGPPPGGGDPQPEPGRVRRVRHGLRAGIPGLHPAGVPRRGRHLAAASRARRCRRAVRTVRNRHGHRPGSAHHRHRLVRRRPAQAGPGHAAACRLG